MNCLINDVQYKENVNFIHSENDQKMYLRGSTTLDYLKAMGTSNLYRELIKLSMVQSNDKELTRSKKFLTIFLSWCLLQIKSGVHFDTVQVYLYSFLEHLNPQLVLLNDLHVIISYLYQIQLQKGKQFRSLLCRNEAILDLLSV